MTTKPEGFADNWAYLKTELNWLDRVLMVAVARQRQESKQLDRIAQSHADRVSSHWWKGIVSLDGNAAYDEHRTATSTSQPKIGYQQQIDARIQLSQEQGVMLALPLLRDRLQLSVIEKNIVLMSLAPEVNRRYARLYRYLQGEQGSKTDLPTVDLVLRLLCRNDQEWRTARMRLSASATLVQRQVLTLVIEPSGTFLNASLKLSDRLVSYLLTQAPTAQELDMLLAPTPIGSWDDFSLGRVSAPAFSSALSAIPAISQPPAPVQLLEPAPVPGCIEHPSEAWPTWSDMIGPNALKVALRGLCAQVQTLPQAENAAAHDLLPQLTPLADEEGAIAILAGPSGTGKTMAARAIAHFLQLPLHWLDLATIAPDQFEQVVRDLEARQPPVLLIKSAEHWLKRSSALSSVVMQQLIRQRHQQHHSLMLFSVRRVESVHLRWRQQLPQVLKFPIPDDAARAQIWQMALAAQVSMPSDLDWSRLAQQYVLTGGEIVAIARQAKHIAAIGQSPVEMAHLHQVLHQHGKRPKRLSSTRHSAL